MRRNARLLGWIIASCAVSCPFAVGDEIQKSVVKIFVSQSPPNMLMPWKITTVEVSGSGVVIEGGRILTNAHVVNYAQQVYVQLQESSDKLDASVEYLSPDCDLATLKLDDASKLKDLKPVALADKLPPLQSKIKVLGYPTGGDTLSVTEGVVSRIEYAPYFHEKGALRIQVDAAVNHGNSGGPGIIDDQIAGIVCSKFAQGEGIGYLIPAEVVRYFLEDWKDGAYEGFSGIGLGVTSLENPDMRAYLKLDSSVTGSLVYRVARKDLQELIHPWDIITQIDGVSIDNSGMIPIADGVRVHASYLASRKPPGSTVTLKILRKGQPADVEVKTTAKDDSCVRHTTQKYPTYYIYGGLTFVPVTKELVLQTGGDFMAYAGYNGTSLTRFMREQRADEDDEPVALSTIIPHKVTKAYRVPPLSIVTRVNDQPVKNLREMIRFIKQCKEEFLVFQFEDDHVERIVLSPKRVQQAMPEILRNNNIPAACSDDLKDMCN